MCHNTYGTAYTAGCYFGATTVMERIWISPETWRSLWFSLIGFCLLVVFAFAYQADQDKQMRDRQLAAACRPACNPERAGPLRPTPPEEVK